MVRLSSKASPGVGAILLALCRLVCYCAQFTHGAFILSHQHQGGSSRHGSLGARVLSGLKPKPLSETNQRDIDDSQHDNLLAVDLLDRRQCLSAITFAASAIVNYDGSASATESAINSQSRTQQDTNMNNVSPVTITLPLEPSSGGTFCVRLTVSASTVSNTEPKTGILWGLASNAETPYRVYRAIVDTGSPYLVLPSSGHDSIDKQKISQWIKAAFASPDGGDSIMLANSEYAATEEIYGAVKGNIDWKLARYAFRDPRLRMVSYNSAASDAPTAGVVGVLDDALTNEATGGGMIEPYDLLGLIRNSNPTADRSRFPDPRPTFFEQERISSTDGENSVSNEMLRIRSFSVNGPLRELSLSTQSMIQASAPAMPLMDLRKYGDFVDHYAVAVDSVSFDEVAVSSKSLKQSTGSSIERPIVAVFDTGLTGCLLIRPFWDAVQKFIADKNSATDEFKTVSLTLRNSQQQKQNNGGSTCQIKGSIEEDRRFYVQPIDLDWFDDEQTSPFVIVLGQTFLRRGALTIDMDDRIATFNLDQ